MEPRSALLADAPPCLSLRVIGTGGALGVSAPLRSGLRRLRWGLRPEGAGAELLGGHVRTGSAPDSPGGLRCPMAGAGSCPVQVHGDAPSGRGAQSALRPWTPEWTLATALQELLVTGTGEWLHRGSENRMKSAPVPPPSPHPEGRSLPRSCSRFSSLSNSGTDRKPHITRAAPFRLTPPPASRTFLSAWPRVWAVGTQADGHICWSCSLTVPCSKRV